MSKVKVMNFKKTNEKLGFFIFCFGGVNVEYFLKYY